MDNLFNEFNKSESIQMALKNKSGIFTPSDDPNVQILWERLASISSTIKLNYADNRIWSVSILKIEGYDFLEDIVEELLFLEYFLNQIIENQTNELDFRYSFIDTKSMSTKEYIIYNASKYKEINVKNTSYVGGGLLKINIYVDPLIKIYNRLLFASEGERMETTITNITDSHVVMGDNNNIKDSFNKTSIESIPSNIIDMINSQKDELLSVGITEEQIDDLINAPTESKIEKFNRQLLPFVSATSGLTSIVSSLAQLIS